MSEQSANEELQALLALAPDTSVLELLQPDMNGILRGKRLGPEEFKKPFTSGVTFCSSAIIMSYKGDVFMRVPYGSRDGDPDGLCRAVPGSLAPVPWASVPTAQVLLSMSELDGGPFFADPRTVLENAARPLAEMGLTPVVATELEFYLLEHDGENFRPKADRLPGTDQPQDGLHYASMDDLASVDPFLADLGSACRAQNIPAGAAISEFSPGQFEVNLKHVSDPAMACEHALLLKRAVKAVAKKHGMAASFMAKPFAEYSGCGLHIHVSLLNESGQNIFAGTSADGAFSDQLRFAVGGLAESMAEGMAIFAPNANSYRRFRPGNFVPMAPNWGPNHRNLALRIPHSGTADTRIEHRMSGADANPYLVVAAVLAGIHHGIANQVTPGPMTQPATTVAKDDIRVPIRWEAALDAYDAGRILPDYLGAKFHKVFGTCRREECDDFHAEVSDRDYDWYLRNV